MRQATIRMDKPDLSNINIARVLDHANKNAEVQEALNKAQYPEYLSWTQVKRKSWIPKIFSPEEFWALLKIHRKGEVQTPILDTEGQYFSWNKLHYYDELFHQLDLHTGEKFLNLRLLSDEEKKGYIARGLIEESIASAQLEGAHTTRDFAKKMIEEGRTPQDLGQKMIMNNYSAMSSILGELKDKPLNLDMLLDLHVVLTKSTLENSDQVGRLRQEDEDIYVGSDNSDISYVPPKMDFVEKQLENLIAFSNDDLGEYTPFLHPVVKAVLLHFWMAFLHPFADGNGRIARALFYWYLLKKGYWIFSFMPVSTRIKKSPVQYSNAFINSEQDDYDLTYFIDYNLRQIEHAKNDFIEYAAQQSEMQNTIGDIAEEFGNLNHRQIELVKFFRKRPFERTNMTAMQKIYGISPVTAITDLKTMQHMDLLARRKKGRHVFYYPTDKLLLNGNM